MIEIVRIPEERINFVMNDETRSTIEKSADVKISFGDGIVIEGDDPINVLKVKKTVTAIGRGFEPEKAVMLLKDGFDMHIISLGSETEKNRKRIFSRLIGRSGTSRRRIEGESGAFMCIYGKTVSIIGEYDKLSCAKSAVEELINGKTHAYAYSRIKWLKDRKKRPAKV